MNETLTKFGYPGSLVHDYEYWAVLLRPAQVTLGALVLGYKGQVTAFSQICREAMQELHVVIQEIEKTLSSLFIYSKINYLMLMMVDPHVHFHVLPRYAENVSFSGREFQDFGWPGLPELNKNNDLNDDTRNALLFHVKAGWKHMTP